MNDMVRQSALLSSLCLLSLAFSACRPTRSIYDELDLVYDSRATPVDISALAIGQPVVFEFDVYAHRLYGWQPTYEERFKRALKVLHVPSSTRATPDIVFSPGTTDATWHVVVRLTADRDGPWVLGIKGDHIRAASCHTSGDYDVNVDCDDELEEIYRFAATVGSCPHITEYRPYFRGNTLESMRVKFSEPLTRAPVVRARRLQFGPGKGCDAFYKDIEMTASLISSNVVEVTVDEEVQRCVGLLGVVFEETPDLSLSFNQDFTCRPAEFVMPVWINDLALDDGLPRYQLPWSAIPF